MIRRSLPARVWRWARIYLVALLLVGGLALSFARTLANDIGPRPQHPPPGYVLARARAQLQWSPGNRDGEIRVQVSTDPGFGELFVDEVPKRSVRELGELEPGATYYWRLVQGDHVSDVARFQVSPTAVRFR